MAPPAFSDTQVEAAALDTSSHDASLGKDRTYIARLILRIQDCLGQLGLDTDNDETIKQMEDMSILIHESMSISSRNYHSVQHVFDVSKNLQDPIAILAALFHDCVYYNIDGGLSEGQAAKVKGSLLMDDEVLRIHPDARVDDLLRMIIQLYGYEYGQEVTPTSGLNEFLSAVIAVRALEPLLPRTTLAQVACCIEATIPFRPANPMEQLYKRLETVVQDFELDMNEDERVQAIQRAVLLANEDVGNFGTDDLFWFLDNTWSLLPESNEALRHSYLYTVQEFQFAVYKMNSFFSFLQPNVIFQQFRGVPSDSELDRLTQNARRNLEVGRRYVGAKLLSISVLAAFAQLTGGDAPISLFMGDLPSRNRESRRLEDSLPLPHALEENCDQDVYELLAHGRRRETFFDVRQSPLAAYFYAFLGDEGLESVLTQIQVYPMNHDTAVRLLSSLPRQAVQHVAINMAQLAMSRQDAILQVVQELPSKDQDTSGE